jgi:hypothetical protein
MEHVLAIVGGRISRYGLYYFAFWWSAKRTAVSGARRMTGDL